MNYKNQYVLSEEDIKKAADYVPIVDKVAFVNEVSMRCFNKLEITAEGTGSQGIAMPPMYSENTELKSRYLMGAFVKMYLKKDIEPCEGENWLLSRDDYDRWAGHHIFNQVERLKQGTSAECKNKCFDIIQDYKDLEKRLSTEIYGQLQVMNDVCPRLRMMIEEGSTPEAMQDAMRQLGDLKKELESYTRKVK